MLGGGAAGLTAAFELTRDGSFDVTVYQLGWRLGGKGASGRNMSRGARIEEHGLHVWFGFYANAFALMRDVYRELARRSDMPLATIDEAFRPCDQIVLYDKVGGAWHGHPSTFPRIGRNPWDERHSLPTFRPIVFEAIRRAGRMIASVDRPHALAAAEAESRLAVAEQLVAPGLAPRAIRPAVRDKLVKQLQEMRNVLRRRWDGALSGPGAVPRLRMIFTTIDAFTAMAVGIVKDDVLGKGFQHVDACDWAEWLARHGASPLTVGATFADRAPVLRSVYDVAFCFPGGDVEKPSAAAGTATSNLLRLQFTYRGAIAYKMTAGMGDVVFAPLYEVLRRRGVKFRFFHAVNRLRLSGDGRRVEKIEVIPQARFRSREYEPLVPVKRLPCWPSEPRWEQLEKDAASCGTRFETELNPLGREPTTLERGKDFDDVVLAIPVGALSPMCDELMGKNVRFREMVQGSATVATQAFQIWLRESPKRLRFPYREDSIVSSYVEPLDTYCDMGHLLEAEDWSKRDGIAGLLYACGVQKDEAGKTPPLARARNQAVAYLENDIGRLLPGAVGRGPGAPFRWDLLAGPGRRTGASRFDDQYLRANSSPWERYVITPAGSVDKRLAADDSGFENLVLAGDWTKTAINGGCVEAAVMSGMQAARAISGIRPTIVGEDTRWLSPP